MWDFTFYSDHSPSFLIFFILECLISRTISTRVLTNNSRYHVKENYIDDVPQGWLARDHDAWVRSHQMVKALAKRTKAKVILGHCLDTIHELGLEFAPKVYE